VYNNPTVANEPNLKQGSKLFVSNILQPKVGDFVCYKYGDSLFASNIRVHRLCAMENDTVELKNGVLFVNQENLDSNFKLLHFYAVNDFQYETLKYHDAYVENEFLVFGIGNSRFMALEDSLAVSLGFKRAKAPQGHVDGLIRRIYGKNWNDDDFGPIIIPKGKIFVLGDNRDNTEDSRHIGLIDYNDIVGVVLNK
jgi:signal peptidase I